MILARLKSSRDGIFGHLLTDDGGIVCVTLEHAYPATDHEGFVPKLPMGTYTCVRGAHRLTSMTKDFETFEVKGVPGHTGILFHAGNWNRDSHGCILVGQAFHSTPDGEMITSSRSTFHRLMEMWKDVDRFELTVTAGTEWV